VRPGDDETAIVRHMLALYANSLQEMREDGIPEEGTEVTVIDAATMYELSSASGLRPITLYAPAVSGVVGMDVTGGLLLEDAGVLLGSPGDGADGILSEGAHKITRSVPSGAGNRKVEGTVRVPGEGEIWGVDFAEGKDEGAFAYFGLSSDPAGTFDMEVGVCTRENAGRHDQKKWYAYHSGTGYPFAPDLWPSTGLPAGSSVFIRMWVPANKQIGGYLSANGLGSFTHTYNIPGVRYDGRYQHFRRNTTMVLETGGGMSNVRWSEVRIYTPDVGGGHLWGISDTDVDGIINDPPVQVSGLQPYSAETVSIDFEP
jgi:hypothetical protein